MSFLSPNCHIMSKWAIVPRKIVAGRKVKTQSVIEYAIFYHSLAYTIPLVGHGPELVTSTY